MIQARLAALVAGARRRDLSRAGARHHRGELDPCLEGLPRGVNFFSAFFPPISSALELNRRRP